MTTSESSQDGRLKVVVTGAAGNVGTSVIEALAARDEVREIVGLARRSGPQVNKMSWVKADVVGSELEPIFAGADAVIHLGRAFALAAVLDVRGPFNLAADPPLGSPELAAALNAGTFAVPFSVARRIADLSWRPRNAPRASLTGSPK